MDEAARRADAQAAEIAQLRNANIALHEQLHTMEARIQAQFEAWQNQRTPSSSAGATPAPPPPQPSQPPESEQVPAWFLSYLQSQQSQITNPRRPIMDNTERFDGSDPKLYPAFARGIRGKFRNDGYWYPTEVSRTDYIYDRLSGKAKTLARAWLEATEKTDPAKVTMDDLLDTLNRAYGDDHAEQRAIDKLSRLQQGQQAISSFLAFFDTTLTEAGGYTWVDDVKINYLKRALKSEIRQGMIGSTVPRTYSEFCTFIREIDSQIWEAKQCVKPAASAPKPPTQAPPADPNAMDWTRSIARTATGTTRARITPEEKERRRQLGLCFRCAEKGHLSLHCPLGQKSNAPVPRIAPVAETNDVESEKEEPLS